MEFSPKGHLTRRALLGSAVSAAVILAAGSAQAVPKITTRARIVIAGAGAAGLSTASRLVQRLDGAEIVLIDAHKAHYYQPGFTLIAAGLQPKAYSISATRDELPPGVRLIEDNVAVFEPENNRVVTAGGQTLTYDFRIVATGLHLDYDAIGGMDTRLIGREGTGSVYAGPDAAEATWKATARFAETGVVGLFHRPETEMKFAGAPLKYAFLTEDHLRSSGTRGRAEIIYAAQNKTLFSRPGMVWWRRAAKKTVMPGLDPGIHAFAAK